MVTFTGGIILPQGRFKVRVSLPPIWVSATNLGSNHESKTITESAYSVVASDPENDPLIYSLVSGTLPTSATLNSNGTITGPAVTVTSDQQFDFTARVSDGISSVDKAFSITVNENANPTWSGGTAADLGSVEENSSVNIQLTALDSDGLPMALTYSTEDSLPGTISLSSGGLLTGTAPDIESDTSFMFTITASDGDESADRQFTLEVTNIPDQFPAVAFDTSVALRRFGSITATDKAQSLISFWFKFSDPAGDNLNTFVYTFRNVTDTISAVRLGGTKKWRFKYLKNDPNNVTALWQAEVNAAYSSTQNPGWHHVLIATNFGVNPVKTQIFIDNSSAAFTNLFAPGFTFGSIDFTTSDVLFNTNSTAEGNKGIFDISEFYLTNQFLDITNSGNRSKFISGGKPVDLTGEGLDGALPTGTAPLIYLHNPTSTWHNNLGTGGGFSLRGGTLSTATSGPND